MYVRFRFYFGLVSAEPKSNELRDKMLEIVVSRKSKLDYIKFQNIQRFERPNVSFCGVDCALFDLSFLTPFQSQDYRSLRALNDKRIFFSTFLFNRDLRK